MWKCEVCNRENADNVRVCKCGFDRSIDYVKYPVITKLNAWDKKKYEKCFLLVEEIKSAATTQKKTSVQTSKTTSPTVPSITPVQIPKPATASTTAKATPAQPAKPVTTTSTTAKATPAHPAKPVTTTSAIAKTAPVQPAKAVTTTSTTAKVTSVQPAKPVTTTSTTAKATPAQPAKPVTTTSTTAKTAPVQPAKPATASTTTKKTPVQPVKSTTPANSTVQKTVYSKDLKSIMPKTKLDWILVVIGLELLFVSINQIDSVGYLTGGYLIPMINIYNYSVEAVLFFLSISYFWMYIILKNIQYDKKKWQIIIYPIVSIFAVSFFVDTVWNILMIYNTDDFYKYLTEDNILASFFGIQLLLIILAFVEDPAKVIVKRKSKRISLIPKTETQRAYLFLGGFLLFFFLMRESFVGYDIDFSNLQTWKIIAIDWILLYWLSIRMEDAHKGWKALISIVLTPAPLALVIDWIFGNVLADFLGNAIGLSMNIVETVMVITFFIVYISFIAMAAMDEEL